MAAAETAAGHAAEGGPSASEYIIHHLTHLQNRKQTDIVDFSVFNLDSIFFAVLLGVVGSFLLWRAAKSATSGVPGRFQAAVEILVEMVDSRPKASSTTPKAASWWPRWPSLCSSGFS